MADFIHHLDRAIIRAAVDDRFGEGTSAIIEECGRGQHTQEEISIRLGVSKQAINQRIRRAKTYARRLLIAAGILEQQPNEINQKPNIHSNV